MTTKEGSTKKLFEVIEILCILIIVIVQRLSRVQLFVTPWTAAHQASLSFTNSRSLLKLMSIDPVVLCNHLILCHPFLLSASVFPGIRVFSNELALRIRWPKHRSFSTSVSHEYSELISLSIDWFDVACNLPKSGIKVCPSVIDLTLISYVILQSLLNLPELRDPHQ